MLILDLILDGNYILNRNVHILHKNNLLFGSLYKSLENSVLGYRKLFPFCNVYFVSDSKEKSWRKKFYSDYKSTRKRESDIDWDFVHATYNDFKNDISSRGIKVLESPHIEGDDFISYLSRKSNDKGISVLIVSNDYDIKQIVKYSTKPLFINFMSNEVLNRQKVFLPQNYQIFLNEVNKLNNDDIFSLNDNTEFINLINTFTNRYEIVEIDPIEALMVKVISGDQSDNIISAWSINKNGRKHGIGQKGAKNIFDSYLTEFGEMNIADPDLLENIADLICEKKKLSKSDIFKIKENLDKNMKLIYLDIDFLPREVKKRMDDEYAKLK